MKVFRKYKFFFDIAILKTIYFNFHYFSFANALKLPCIVMKHTQLRKMGGDIECTTPIKTAMFVLGSRSLGSIDHSYKRTIWEVQGKVVLGNKISIGSGSRICVGPYGTLKLGDNFLISGDSMMLCSKYISFGADCLLSWDITIMDDDQHPIYNNEGKRINDPKPITIGDHVWIGCRSTILKVFQSQMNQL